MAYFFAARIRRLPPQPETVVAIPAGTYRQVRVRFTGALPATDEVTAKIACGGAGFNCAVMEDDTIQPLLFDTACPELRITSERIVDGFFLALPDVESELVIDMTPVWSSLHLQIQVSAFFPR